MITRLNQVVVDHEIRFLWPSFINNDFFSFYKMVWLLFFSAILLVLFLGYIYKEGYIKTKFYIPTLFYVVFAIISTVTSSYTNVALFGLPDRYEGLLILFSYILLTVISFNIVNDKKSTELVLKALFISAFILGIHGILQYYNLNFFNTEIGKKLIAPEGLEVFVNNYNFRFDRNIIFSTMYNPNYVGSYGSMCLCIINVGKQKKWIK